MKTKLGYLILLMMAPLAIYVAGCGGDESPVEPKPVVPTVLTVVVRSGVDSSFVEYSNVVVYQAENSEAVLRGMTDASGAVQFNVEAGNYFLNVSAQGFNPVPPENITPLPFFVMLEDTTIQDVLLNDLENPVKTGYVQGHVVPAVNNFLILAESRTDQEKYSTVTGPDGFFVMYNLPYGTYDMNALKAGYRMVADVEASVSGTAEVDTVQVDVAQYTGSLLNGSVTFLASENSTVDITLLDPETRAVIPGLSVMSDVSGLNYRIEHIPDGDYIAWASLQNDGYVIDPDWVFKNPGGLDISFATSSTLELNFSVTGAIRLVSPTNPPDSTIAYMAESQSPVFSWVAYSSAKEYFIEVKDFGGNVLWGGIDPGGEAQHAFIGAGVTSVEYNFDNQPGVPALKPGEVYQWKIWADKGTQQDGFVEQLISSSEDLMGIFQVPDIPTP